MATYEEYVMRPFGKWKWVMQWKCDRCGKWICDEFTRYSDDREQTPHRTLPGFPDLCGACYDSLLEDREPKPRLTTLRQTRAAAKQRVVHRARNRELNKRYHITFIK